LIDEPRFSDIITVNQLLDRIDPRIRVICKDSLGRVRPPNQASTVLCRSGGVQPWASPPQQGA